MSVFAAENNPTITMEYTVIIQKDPASGMYSGQCKQIPEAISQGSTVDELLKNMKEAIELAIECRDEELRETYLNHKVFHRHVTVTA